MIILESTVYPGFTRDILKKELERNVNINFNEHSYLAFSPERIDPNNKQYLIDNTPKLVGGINKASTDMAVFFYERVIKKVVPVISSEVAEMTKIFENTYRLINISYVNEMAILCKRIGISIWDVIDAAATKPFGFTKFIPGSGVGGACIPVNPYYLKYKLRMLNCESKTINAALDVNNDMPEYIVSLVSNSLNELKMSINGSSILIIGVSYKPNIDDVRESPALYIIESLIKRGANVSFYDPFVENIKLKSGILHGVKVLDETYDCAVIVTNHTCIDYNNVKALSFVDTTNATKDDFSDSITKL